MPIVERLSSGPVSEDDDGGALPLLEVAVPSLGTLVFLWARLRDQSGSAPTFLHVATNLPGRKAPTRC